MAVAHDAVTTGGEFSGASPHTVNHTPVGTPKGVLVFICQGGTAAGNDTITGVTYGGTAMTRVATNGWASDSSGEAGSTFAYFLGASVPTGAQDCVVSTNGGSALKWVYVITLTGAADLEITASGKVEGDAANPQVALDSSATTALRYCCIYSGLSSVASLTLLADHTAVSSHDFGNYVSRVDMQTTPGSGSFTVGYTSASDDVAMVGVAVSEVAGGGLSATIAQASETDTALAVSRLRSLTVDQPSATHTALAVTGSSRTTVGQAVDIASALPVGRAHAFTVGQAVSTNAAAALTATSRTVVAQATDISTAGALARTRTRATTQASVTNTAQPVSSTHTRALGQAASIASAGAMTVAGGNTIGTASEVSAARLLGALSVRQVAQASSVGAALSVAGRRASTLTQAVSTSAALGLGSRKTRLVLAATGADTAFSVGIPAPVLPAVVRLDVGHGVSGMGGGAGVSGVADGLGVSQVESSSELIGVG